MSALAAELNSGRLRIVEIQTIKKWDDIACTALEELAIAKDILHQHSLSQSEKEDLREVRTKRHSQLVEVIEMQQQMLESRLPTRVTALPGRVLQSLGHSLDQTRSKSELCMHRDSSPEVGREIGMQVAKDEQTEDQGQEVPGGSYKNWRRPCENETPSHRSLMSSCKNLNLTLAFLQVVNDVLFEKV